MTHKYKVGDKIRMLTDSACLVKGGTYKVIQVDWLDERRPVRVVVGKQYRWPHHAQFELVTEEQEDNTDLTENLIPFGLLEPDVQERMKAWEHGHERWSLGVWVDASERLPLEYITHFRDGVVYRAKPAPVEPERVTVWMNVYEEHIGSVKDSRKDADTWGLDDRIALWRITYDKETGLNPVIEVEGETE